MDVSTGCSHKMKLFMLFCCCTMAATSANVVDGYRVVNLRSDLEVKPRRELSVYNKEALTEARKPQSFLRWENRKSPILAHYKNVEITVPGVHGSLFTTFNMAYNNHEDVTLVPDDVWLTILFQFSKYVNANAEALRNRFVDHTDQKELTVTTGKELSEGEWDEFFTLMIDEIKSNTKDGITEVLQCDFSTTGLIERMVSTATVMDTFKKYFTFGRSIPMCGIKNLRFAGTLEDWQNLLVKFKRLKTYGLVPDECTDREKQRSDTWEQYVDDLVPILEEFVEAYQGHVNHTFWDKVMNKQHGSLGSGSTTTVSGWILKFYGHDGSVGVDNIDDERVIDVPVKIDNRLTGIVKTVQVRAGFGGLYEENGSYRPQLTMVVYEKLQ